MFRNLLRLAFLWMLLESPPTFAQQIFPAYSPTIPYNLQRTWLAQKPITTESEMVSSSKTTREVHQSTIYIDGLVRPFQTVDKQASPAGMDMVKPGVYDAYGREQFQYLPFASNSLQSGDVTNDGSLKLDAFQQQSAFSKNEYPGQNYFYTQTTYEPSPLNRTTNNDPEGNQWVGSSRGTATQYQINTSVDNVQTWNIYSTPGSLPISAGAYPAGQLDKIVITDAQNHKQIVYKDNLGQIVLKKVQNSATPGGDHTGWLCTYYVYDDLGNLRFVIPPDAVQLMNASGSWSINQTTADALCFRYEYDSRNRKAVEKTPGKGEVDYVYDISNRLAFSQDANMHTSGQWLTYLYDIFDRVVATGITGYTGTTSQLQQSVTTQNTAQVNSSTLTQDLPLSSPNTTGNYTASHSITMSSPFSTAAGGPFSASIVSMTSQATSNTQLVSITPIPNGSAFSLLTATYYDNYSWTGQTGLASSINQTHTTDGTYFNTSYNTNPDYAQPITQYASARGLITGTMAAVLPANGQLLYTESFYDDRARVIQTQSFNITGGLDITTRQYDFTGKVLRQLVQHTKNGNNPQSHTVLTKNSYDPMGRLQTITKIIQSTIGGVTYSVPEKTIASYQYNELGLKKTTSYGSNLETMSYDYNVRGWMVGANRSYLNGQSSHYFGFETGFDNPASSVPGTNYNTPEYNGNLSGVMWKTAGDQKAKKYDFTYDPSDRLTIADFNQYSGSAFDKSAGLDFSVPNLAYDHSGNITYMQQNGWKLGGSLPIDKLTYAYSNSNQLTSVTEDPSIGNMDNHLGDFTDNNQTNDDYTYDANGNLMTDKNKRITAITYDFLNQPQQISFNQANGSPKGTVSYIHDANGIVLTKTVTDQTTSPATTTTTTYIGGFVYQNDNLQFLTHEEGRVRFATTYPQPGTSQQAFVFDYFLKDQQNNTRVVLTEQADVAQYVATMEPGNRTKEDALFTNIDNTSLPIGQATGMPDDVSVTNPNQNVSHLDGVTQKVGPGIVLKVMSGDVVDVATQYYYNNISNTNPPQLSASNIINSVASGLFALTGGSHGEFTDMTASGSPISSALTSFLNTNNPALTSKPQAYLNWILLDNQFNYVQTYPQSGAVPVGSGGTTSTGGLQLPIGRTGIPITTSGYLYVYVSNATPNWDVYFDNLTVITHSGPLLEENHYYPYGLTMAGISDQALKSPYAANKYRYNGGSELQNKEFSDGSGMEMYNTLKRELDPQIGRWWQVDPKPDVSFTPYAAMKNNPLLHNDPLGDTIYIDEEGYIQRNTNTDNLVYEEQTMGKDPIYLGQLGGEIDLTNILPNLLHSNAMVAAEFKDKLLADGPEAAWVMMVLPGGSWDLKDNKETIFGEAWQWDLMAHRDGDVDVHTSFKSDYMTFYDAAAVGNFDAGYTGIYAGVTPEEQYKWAGLGEMVKLENFIQLPTRMWQWWWHIPPYGDQPVDYMYNTQGMAQAMRELHIDPKADGVSFP